MKAKVFKSAVNSATKEKTCGFRVQTGIRAGRTLQSIISAIPANLRSYS